MAWIVICYDIADDRRRYLAARTLLGFGSRVQKSVFECYLSPRERRGLLKELTPLIHPEEDSLRIYTLCAKDKKRFLSDGNGIVTEDWDFMVIE